MSVDVAPAGRFPAEARTIRKTAARLLALLAPDEDVAFLLVDAAEMAEMNQRWRGKAGPTDVLSWESAAPGHLGDVALCVDVARAQAVERGHTLEVELSVLVTHAVAHLCGLDHERSHDEALLQAEVEMGLLDVLGRPPEAALGRRGLAG